MPFNVASFEEMITNGRWAEVESFLSSFTNLNEKVYSQQMFFEIRKQKYLEELDNSARKAVDILVKELKCFQTTNEFEFHQLVMLLPLGNSRNNTRSSSYPDKTSARLNLVTRLKKLIEKNPSLSNKLPFPITNPLTTNVQPRSIHMISEPAQCQSLRISTESPEDKVKIMWLAYTDSGTSIVALARDCVHLYWEWTMTINGKLIMWNTANWEKQKSRFSHSITTPEPKKDLHLQFYRDQAHLLVVNYAFLAVYETTELVCEKQWNVPDMSLIQHATLSCDSALIYSCFFDGTLKIFEAVNLQLLCQINSTAYIQFDRRPYYATSTAAHPQDPNQFAVGFTDGSIQVFEPLDVEGRWDLPMPVPVQSATHASTSHNMQHSYPLCNCPDSYQHCLSISLSDCSSKEYVLCSLPLVLIGLTGSYWKIQQFSGCFKLAIEHDGGHHLSSYV
ncbi:hypothetical protein ACFE04_016490 [Oxalis oulophora]